MNREPSIRRQLLHSLTGSLALLYTIGALTVYFWVKISAERQFDEHLQQRLADFAAETELDEQGRIEGTFHDLDLQTFSGAPQSGYYELRDSSGQAVLASLSLGEGASLPFRAMGEREMRLERITLPNGEPGRIGYLSFRAKPDPDHAPADYDPTSPRNWGHLALALPDAEVRQITQVLAFALLCTGLGLMFAMRWIVSHQIEQSCRPIERLAQLTGAMHPEELSSRLPATGLASELSPLVHQFNILLDRLEKAFQRERSFSGGIAHEIRTPLAELSALLSSALIETDREDLQEIPEDVYREAAGIGNRMTRLVEAISAIHLAESGKTILEIEDLDPRSMLEDVFASLRPSLTASKMEVSLSDLRSEEEQTISTDPVLLHAILFNLAGNAVVHSKEGSTIECFLESGQSGSQRLRFLSSPLDFDPNDLERLTETFWQKDASRTEAGRFGLGLKLVESYARLIESRLSFQYKKERFEAILELSPLD